MSISVKDKTIIEDMLDACFDKASHGHKVVLPAEVKTYLDNIFNSIDAATSGYSNLITCLVCSAVDHNIDPRFHRKPGKGMPAPSNGELGWFSGRTISEQIIYPWMEKKGFRTAKSGWQTRTYERPNPYTLDYPENIALIKDSFLRTLQYSNSNRGQSADLIVYLFVKEIEFQLARNKIANSVAKTTIGNEVLIIDIINALERHFSLPQSSHLPVIAIYSIYQTLIDGVGIYGGLNLKELESHQASDFRTGAIGDIELEDSDGDIVEAIEVKHGFEIDLSIVLRAREKILRSKAKRYYMLTTHKNCGFVSHEVATVIRDVYKNHGCQIITNGVLPTIKYYLRMAKSPKQFVENYSKNISVHHSVTKNQLVEWNRIVESI
jgi:DNA (cytosine-5)-methyltransferase 1